MRLWTIQKTSFYKKLKAKGCMKAANFHKAKTLDVPQYEWLGRQMVLKGISQALISPIWAWYKYDGLHKKPDLRCSAHMPRGTRSVCIEFEAEDNMVLLSQFDMWCWVLNGGYLPCDQRECDQIEKLEDSGKLSQSRIKKSWSRMFDLNFGCEDFWGPKNERRIQACTTEICMDQVKNVQEFISR